MIVHPSENLTPDERAYQMWAVHPLDLDRLGFQDRQSFYKAHIEAAIKQSV